MFKRPVFDKIELYFKMSFKDIILKLHWIDKLSIKHLSDLCEVSRDTFQRHAKRLNLPLRSIQESNKLTTNKGANHWAFGLNKNNNALYLKHSQRMKSNNPMNNNSSLIKVAKANAVHFKNKPLIQEVIFKEMLDEFKIKYIFQYPINRYVIDFFIPKLNLCIEIDSTDKWGKVRRNRAAIKDLFLTKNNFNVLRINKRLLKNKLFIFNILKTNNII